MKSHATSRPSATNGLGTLRCFKEVGAGQHSNPWSLLVRRMLKLASPAVVLVSWDLKSPSTCEKKLSVGAEAWGGSLQTPHRFPARRSKMCSEHQLIASQS